MRKSIFMLVLGLFFAAVVSAACDRSDSPLVTVYKTPTCGCCKKWVGHLRENGFNVRTVEVADLREIKTNNGVPGPLASCHTALVDGYVVEGHVPAEDIRQLLDERPRVTGLTVPGMPVGSPGMEGRNPESYVVYAFDENGKASRFASHGP